MIAVWDDHESANNAWHDGAQNHDDSEGDWPTRRAAAVRAYREWLPIRDPDPWDPKLPDLDPRNPDLRDPDRWDPKRVAERDRTYRAFRFGDLAELVMLDTRLVGRDQQAPRGDLAAVRDPGRQLLGTDQEAWLFERLDQSQAQGVAWRLLGQQVVMGQLALPGTAGNPDAWDGYPEARDRLLAHIESSGIDGVVVLSGDVHSSWAMDLARDPYDPEAYDPATGRGSLAVEMVTPAVASSPLARFEQVAKLYENATRTRPHLRFVDLEHRGFVLLDVTREHIRGEWYWADDVTRADGAVSFATAWQTARRAAHLTPAPKPEGGGAASSARPGRAARARGLRPPTAFGPIDPIDRT
jgi:alkaline phosphatase D